MHPKQTNQINNIQELYNARQKEILGLPIISTVTTLISCLKKINQILILLREREREREKKVTKAPKDVS